jgi:hypothetical protein
MSEKVNAYRVFMGKFEAKKRYDDPVLDGTAILKRMLSKYERVW